MTRKLGYAALAAYAACIVLANYFISHVGTQAFPGGPHTIPVGLGYQAPSGVLFIGLAFTVRDFVQTTLGKPVVVAAIAAGAALSFLVAPNLALASGVAFGASELLDFAVYSPIVERGRVLTAILLSNTAGLLIDSFLFLWLAFHSIRFWHGQVLGKAEMTLLAVAVLIPARRRWATMAT